MRGTSISVGRFCRHNYNCSLQLLTTEARRTQRFTENYNDKTYWNDSAPRMS